MKLGQSIETITDSIFAIFHFPQKGRRIVFRVLKEKTKPECNKIFIDEKSKVFGFHENDNRNVCQSLWKLSNIWDVEGENSKYLL